MSDRPRQKEEVLADLQALPEDRAVRKVLSESRAKAVPEKAKDVEADLKTISSE